MIIISIGRVPYYPALFCRIGLLNYNIWDEEYVAKQTKIFKDWLVKRNQKNNHRSIGFVGLNRGVITEIFKNKLTKIYESF